MRHWIVILIVGFVAELAALQACTPGQRETARTALEIAKVTCLIAKQALPDADALRACDVAEPFFDPARQVLSGARAASAQAVAGAHLGACGPDGGAR